jgi:DNA-binding IclR family transcriptional regulator
MGVLTALTITASRIFSLFVKNPFVLVKFLAAITEQRNVAERLSQKARICDPSDAALSAIDAASRILLGCFVMSNIVAYPRTYATSLLKGLKLLSLFRSERAEWGVTEISVALKVAKSTVSRIAHTLEAEGFLTRSANRERFRLGIRLWELGCVALDENSGFQEKARACLEALVAASDESAQAAILDRLEVVYVDKVDAPQSLRPYTCLGARFPAHCTATGRALLAFAPDREVSTLIKKGLRRYTERTVVEGAKLRAELARIRSQGYAVNRGEWRSDIGGIAAPVSDRTGVVIGAIGITVPLSRFPKNPSLIIKQVVKAAGSLSRQLGWLPGLERKLGSTSR